MVKARSDVADILLVDIATQVEYHEQRMAWYSFWTSFGSVATVVGSSITALSFANAVAAGITIDPNSSYFKFIYLYIPLLISIFGITQEFGRLNQKYYQHLMYRDKYLLLKKKFQEESFSDEAGSKIRIDFDSEFDSEPPRFQARWVNSMNKVARTYGHKVEGQVNWIERLLQDIIRFDNLDKFSKGASQK